MSVIVPAHDRVEALRDCIDSVAAQTYAPLELIVVDDCSAADLRVEVDRVGPDLGAVRYLRTESNGGPGAARELGRRVANGGFLAYLDSDDCWHPEKLAIQVEALQRNPTAGMCYCTTLEFVSLPVGGREPIRRLSDQGFDSILPIVLERRPWATSSCLWTRQATDAIGPWLPTWHWEDYEYDCRAGCRGVKTIWVDRALCYYRKTRDGQRLSEQDRSFVARQRAASLLAMTAELRRAGEVHDRSVRGPLIRRLEQTGALLTHLGQHDVARALLGPSVWLGFGEGMVGSLRRAGRWMRTLPVLRAARRGRSLRRQARRLAAGVARLVARE